MDWRHYEVRATGAAVLVTDKGASVAVAYEMGVVATGRTRVWAGYFVRVMLPGETEFSGENERSLRRALRTLAVSLAAMRLELRCVGLDERWSESGLSVDTGWGYIDGHDRAIHMMDAVP